MHATNCDQTRWACGNVVYCSWFRYACVHVCRRPCLPLAYVCACMCGCACVCLPACSCACLPGNLYAHVFLLVRACLLANVRTCMSCLYACTVAQPINSQAQPTCLLYATCSCYRFRWQRAWIAQWLSPQCRCVKHQWRCIILVVVVCCTD